jgi:autotransporter translocation and assembly factor TamB
MPLLFQGVSQATATGVANIKLQREKDLMRVDVDVLALTAKLPESSGRTVDDLADNPAIVVAQPLREPRPKRTGEILPWRFVINLRRGVKLRRSDLEIPLVGQPVVELGQKTNVSGYVELEPGGRFQAWGKTFVIDTGRVIFDTPDPGDPHITAAANWRSPDGTVVYADVRGTLKDAKITVSSDPPHSEPEIMAILFGGSSGSSGSGAEDTGSSRSREGSAAAGGVLATAFNSLFAESLSRGPVQVELRTSTNQDKASYTAAVRLAENIWFEGTYRNRLEAQQDATSAEPVDVSGTIDYRFRRNWSLRTEVGTLGTGLDLLFQYRY